MGRLLVRRRVEMVQRFFAWSRGVIARWVGTSALKNVGMSTHCLEDVKDYSSAGPHPLVLTVLGRNVKKWLLRVRGNSCGGPE